MPIDRAAGTDPGRDAMRARTPVTWRSGGGLAKAWLLLACAMFGSLMLSAPGTGGLIPTPWDKVAHVGFFGGLAVALGLGLGPRGIPFAFLGAVTAGVVDEGYQVLLPTRSAGLDDLLADVLGAALAVLFLRWRFAMAPRATPSRQD